MLPGDLLQVSKKFYNSLSMQFFFFIQWCTGYIVHWDKSQWAVHYWTYQTLLLTPAHLFSSPALPFYHSLTLTNWVASSKCISLQHERQPSSFI